jgi:hypothetical protein
MEQCEKCKKTLNLHGTLCKKHKTPDLDKDQANDMQDVNGDLIEIKED